MLFIDENHGEKQIGHDFTNFMAGKHQKASRGAERAISHLKASQKASRGAWKAKKIVEGAWKEI